MRLDYASYHANFILPSTDNPVVDESQLLIDTQLPGDPVIKEERAPNTPVASSRPELRIATSPHAVGDDGWAKDIRSRRNLSAEYGEADPGDEEMKESASVPDVPAGDVPVGDSDDPNILVPGEEPEDGDASVYDDDEDLGPLELDPGIVDEDVSPPELHFDKSLLGAVRGVAKIVRVDLKSDFLKNMKANGWPTPLYQTPYPYMNEPYENRPEDWMSNDYPDRFGGKGGLLSLRWLQRLRLWKHFSSPRLLEAIAGTTNDYFMENLDPRVEAQLV
ncbi:LOW QUALITY PROTEIN: hypothetical protein PHMEG_0004015 [Phytophthora megakarya]|uniref:Uncharacterized protein n=1 Tax=Phytophthora megakarya TaxID=4795 RepID=A0A225WUV5_9STRA|nr:LOW QUALITY PROTEIN: hypothetical protein PHMEG_0004015 [Phytophthora megakarya]